MNKKLLLFFYLVEVGIIFSIKIKLIFCSQYGICSGSSGNNGMAFAVVVNVVKEMGGERERNA